MKRIQNYDRDGFTLVELLTVVGIIVLLVAILVPAVNSVRNQAKNTTTKASIGTISTGLETFRADQTVGGLYPPSASDSTRGNERDYMVESPYSDLRIGSGGQRIRMTGAGLLVWALAGADLLGTPGFRSFDDDTDWWDDTHTRGKFGGCYALTDNSREPVTPRSGPFVDLNTIRVTKLGDSSGGNRFNKVFFPIPTEKATFEANGKGNSYNPNNVERTHPMFLDAFDNPILYWRADPAGLQVADPTPDPSAPRKRGIYHFEDNSPLLIGDGDFDPLWLSVNRKQNDPHELDLSAEAPIDPVELREATGPKAKKLSFARAIQDINISAKSAPQNAKSFLLWSPGRDGVFGNADDVTNFKPFGGE